MRSMKKILMACMLAMALSSTAAPSASMTAGLQTIQAAARIRLSKSSATLIKGQTLQLKLSDTHEAVTWSSSKKSVATVNSSGKVTAKAKGTANIKAKAGKKKYVCKITVETPELSATSLSLTEGQTYQLTVSGTSKKIKWSSNNNEVVTISNTGTVMAITEGVCTVTAKIGSKNYTCSIYVAAKPHDFTASVTEPTCTEQGYTTYTCIDCDYTYIDSYVNALGHDYKTTVIEPTTLQEGYTEYVCRRCGDSYKENITFYVPTEQQVYNAILAMKSQYPEGMPWTNANYYEWNGGIYSGGSGCAGFAFAMSDAAFGNLPARKHTNYSDIRVGDILRVNNNSHSVIVLEVTDTYIAIAEGNYGGRIHWGDQLSRSELQGTGNYIMTRYPQS